MLSFNNISKPSPIWSKIALYAIVYGLPKLLMNLAELGIDEKVFFWKVVKLYTPEILLGCALLKDMLKKRTLNDKVEEKKT